MPDNHTGIGHVVRCNHHSKPGKGGCGFFGMRHADRFYNGKRNDIQGKMNGLEKLIGQMTDDVREINGILKARSRELDRRAEFDKEISEEIQSILNKRKDEHRHSGTEPYGGGFRASGVHASCKGL